MFCSTAASHFHASPVTTFLSIESRPTSPVPSLIKQNIYLISRRTNRPVAFSNGVVRFCSAPAVLLFLFPRFDKLFPISVVFVKHICGKERCDYFDGKSGRRKYVKRFYCPLSDVFREVLNASFFEFLAHFRVIYLYEN